MTLIPVCWIADYIGSFIDDRSLIIGIENQQDNSVLA